jgi:uncharacterized protein YndB with AHSA1/START domain
VINFEASVRIDRPVEDVFAFVSDPLLFPRWNSAVRAVDNISGATGEVVSGATGEVGSTYSMRRELPGGQVENELEVLVRVRPEEFVIRTTSGPTPFHYHYRFAPDGAGTVVHLEASVELPGVAGKLGPFAARAVRRGVDANFGTLKRILEGRARDAQSGSV